MAFVPWNCAHGEAAPAYLTITGTTMAIAPADDSVDTNSVVVSGAGTIDSLGVCPHVVLKRVRWIPLVRTEYVPPGGGSGASITLINSNHLTLLGKKNRIITEIGYGMYQTDGHNNWDEIYFTLRGTPSISDIWDVVQALMEKKSG